MAGMTVDETAAALVARIRELFGPDDPLPAEWLEMLRRQHPEMAAELPSDPTAFDLVEWVEGIWPLLRSEPRH